MEYILKEKTTQLIYDFFTQYYQSVTKEQCAELAVYMKEKKLKRGAYFIETGQIAAHFGLITEGVMQNCIVQNDGKERVQYFLIEGQVVSNAASFDLQTPSKLSVRAITNCRLLTIDFITFQKLNQEAEWLKRLVGPISSIVLQEYLKEYADLLRMSQQERYTTFVAKNPKIIHRIPLVMVASYLGMSSQSLSRIRGKVQKKVDNMDKK
jgi:CRP/FNR family transcriptional regulator, anaerobic regulatory protein